MAGRAGGVSVPAAEGVAEAGHRGVVARLGGGVAGLDELRGVVGRALAVLLEDEPAAVGLADAELDVALDGDGVAVLVEVALLVADDVGLALGDEPALEGALGAVGGVAHVDGVGALAGGGVARDLDGLGALGDAGLVDVVDLVALGRGLVVGDRLVGGDLVGLGHGGLADLLDGEQLRVGGVVGVGGPAREDLVGGEALDAGVVDDLGDLVGGVVGLDDHRGRLGGAVLEPDGEARGDLGDDGVDGEALGGDLDLVVCGGGRRDDLGGAGVGDVDDVDLGLGVGARVADGVGGELDGDVALGLDLALLAGLGVGVGEGDVDRGDLAGGDVLGDGVRDGAAHVLGRDARHLEGRALGKGALGGGDVDGHAVGALRREGDGGVCHALLGCGSSVRGGGRGLGVRLRGLGRLGLGGLGVCLGVCLGAGLGAGLGVGGRDLGGLGLDDLGRGGGRSSLLLGSRVGAEGDVWHEPAHEGHGAQH